MGFTLLSTEVEVFEYCHYKITVYAWRASSK